MGRPDWGWRPQTAHTLGQPRHHTWSIPAQWTLPSTKHLQPPLTSQSSDGADGTGNLRVLSQVPSFPGGGVRTSTLPETQRAVCAGMLNHVRLCNPRDCSPPGSSVYGISRARILEQVAISFSRGSSRPGDLTPISCIGRWVLYHWATWRLFTGWPRVLTHILCSSAWPGNSLPLRSSRLWDRPEQAYQHQQWEAQGRLSPDGMGWVWQGVPPWGRREKAAVSGEGWQDEGRTQL